MIDLLNLNPVFIPRLQRYLSLLDQAGIGYKVVSGERSLDLQGKLYANRQAYLTGHPIPYPQESSGAEPAAPPGQSFHNYGLAADIVPTNPANYPRMWDLADQAGLTPLRAYDRSHVQLGTNLAQTLAQYHIARLGSGADTTTGATTMATDTRQIFFDALTKQAGLTPQQALGALWSLGGESGGGFNTGAYNPNDPGGSIGVGQWNGARRWALEALAKAEGKPVTDPHVQAEYMVAELTGDIKSAIYQPGVLDAMKQAKTPEEAARIWTAKFERPTVDNSEKRIANGAAVGSLDANGNFVPGTAKSAPVVAGATGAGAAAAPSGPALSPAQLGAQSLGQALAALGSSEEASALGGGGRTSGGSQVMTEGGDQPAIRMPALEGFPEATPNPVPASLAGGVPSQLAQLGIQAQPTPFGQTPDSITAGAPSMTGMLGQIGSPPDYTMLSDPRRTNSINPYARVPRLA